MIRKLSEAVDTDGATAVLSGKCCDVESYVIGPHRMAATLDERQEQINSLMRAISHDNLERVAADLKRTIITCHVPKAAESEIEEAFDTLKRPVMLRLSPVGKVANPLDPTIVLGLLDMKSVLDAMRMLYAEMYSTQNLATGEKDRSAALIMQPMPFLDQTFRVIPAGNYTVIEASYGYSSWVGYGESDRFLFEGSELKKTEPGDHSGIFYDPDQGAIGEAPRRLVTENDAKAAFAYVQTLPRAAPLLIGKTIDGFVCFGTLDKLPEKND